MSNRMYPEHLYMATPRDGGGDLIVQVLPSDPLLGHRASPLTMNEFRITAALMSLEGYDLFPLCDPTDLVVGEIVDIRYNGSDYHGLAARVEAIRLPNCIADLTILDDSPRPLEDLSLYIWKLRPRRAPWVGNPPPSRPQQLSLF